MEADNPLCSESIDRHMVNAEFGQHCVRVLAELGCSGPYSSRGLLQARHHGMHRQQSNLTAYVDLFQNTAFANVLVVDEISDVVDGSRNNVSFVAEGEAFLQRPSRHE